MNKKYFIAIVLPYLVILSLAVKCFANCNLNSNNLDRGESKAFIICGDDIPKNYIINGLSQANIRVQYEQFLEMCDIGVDKPGIYLKLKAEDDSTSVSISISNTDTKTLVCSELKINVPDRVHIPEASLRRIDKQNSSVMLLEIKGDKNRDLSQVKPSGLIFPRGKWPLLSLISKSEAENTGLNTLNKQPFVSTSSSIRALVKVNGQQRYPAKIIIQGVKVKGASEAEGVSHVSLPPPSWAGSMKDADAKYVDVNGIRTRYFEKGTGDAMVLVHGGQAGGTSNAKKWKQNFDSLSENFHVYAMDRLGSGYTANPKTDKDYKNYYTQVVEHVYGFIKKMGIKKVHLIGQSQGGWPVTRLALDHPEMVLSVVNQDSGMAPDDPLMRTLPFMMYIMFYVNPKEGATHESIRRGMEMWSYSMNNVTEDAAESSLRISRLPKILEARKHMVELSMNPNHPSYRQLRKKVHKEIKEGKLKVPSLVIWGYNDPSMHYEGGIELYKLISEKTEISEFHMFNNCGHSPYIEYPEEFNSLIKNFCGQYASFSQGE